MGNEALHPETKHGATGGGHDQSRKVSDSSTPGHGPDARIAAFFHQYGSAEGI
jgi:hypothetical protein